MVLNTAARLLLRIPKFGHISSAIINTLQWLPVPDRLTFKTCCLVWNSVVGAGPIFSVLPSCLMLCNTTAPRSSGDVRYHSSHSPWQARSLSNSTPSPSTSNTLVWRGLRSSQAQDQGSRTTVSKDSTGQRSADLDHTGPEEASALRTETEWILGEENHWQQERSKEVMATTEVCPSTEERQASQFWGAHCWSFLESFRGDAGERSFVDCIGCTPDLRHSSMHLQFRSVWDHRSLHDSTPQANSANLTQFHPGSSKSLWTNFRHSMPHFSTLRWAAVLSQHLKRPLPSLQFTRRLLSIRTISATTDLFQTWRSYLSFLSVQRTNKLFTTATDFNYFQSCSLPTGNIGQPKQLQSRSCPTFTRRQMQAPSLFSAFSILAPRLTLSTIAIYSIALRTTSISGEDHSVDRVPHGTQSIRAVQRGHLKNCTSHLRRASRVRPGADPSIILIVKTILFHTFDMILGFSTIFITNATINRSHEFLIHFQWNESINCWTSRNMLRNLIRNFQKSSTF